MTRYRWLYGIAMLWTAVARAQDPTPTPQRGHFYLNASFFKPGNSLTGLGIYPCERLVAGSTDMWACDLTIPEGIRGETWYPHSAVMRCSGGDVEGQVCWASSECTGGGVCPSRFDVTVAASVNEVGGGTKWISLKAGMECSPAGEKFDVNNCGDCPFVTTAAAVPDVAGEMFQVTLTNIEAMNQATGTICTPETCRGVKCVLVIAAAISAPDLTPTPGPTAPARIQDVDMSWPLE